jgi:hypothetical protein
VGFTCDYRAIFHKISHPIGRFSKLQIDERLHRARWLTPEDYRAALGFAWAPAQVTTLTMSAQ